MKNFLLKILIYSLIAILAACSTNTPKENKAIGAATGAALGAGLGASSGPSPGPVTMVGMGAIVGALIGVSYETPMDDADSAKALQAIAEGKRVTWQNPKSKITYSIYPAPQCTTFEGNHDCRKFVATQTYADGGIRKISRLACKGSDNAWHLEH